MGLFLTTIGALVVWVVLWAIGVKSFDGFLLATLIVLLAGTLKLLAPYLPGAKRARD